MWCEIVQGSQMPEYITKNAIGFVSREAYFYKEQNYNKSNTVRRLTPKERKLVNQLEPEKIVIRLQGSQLFFERYLSDISHWGDLTIFSWRKDENDSCIIL